MMLCNIKSEAIYNSQASGESNERGGPTAGRRHPRRAQAVAARQTRISLHAPSRTLLYARSLYTTTFELSLTTSKNLELNIFRII